MKKLVLAYALISAFTPLQASTPADESITQSTHFHPRLYVGLVIERNNEDATPHAWDRANELVAAFASQKFEGKIATYKQLFELAQMTSPIGYTILLDVKKPVITRNETTIGLSMGWGFNESELITEAQKLAQKLAWIAAISTYSQLCSYCKATSWDEFDIDYFLAQIAKIHKIFKTITIH